jgi:hypothetical protein
MACLVGIAATACREESSPRPALLLSQAQFVKKPLPDGTTKTVPGPAKLTVVYPGEHRRTHEVIEDADANVFHKAVPCELPGHPPGILTIGANKAPSPATLKLWQRTSNGWTATLLWEARFGGSFNRLRDVEIGDVTGDGQADVVVATHDQGVVVVLERRGAAWEPTEIDRRPNTFVHEIEIGDLDADGRNEVFATPSEPNKVDGTPQPGWVIMYAHEGGNFERRVVAQFQTRHVKEILVADVDEEGPPELYAVLEVQLGKKIAPGVEREEVEIHQYRFTDAEPVGVKVATLPDKQCRFLHAGDVDGDGKTDMVASAFYSGIWLIKPDGAAWARRLIDPDSSGYEHASALADIDGDGRLEIYAAADKQGALRRYEWTGSEFKRSKLFDLGSGHITFGLVACRDTRRLNAR